MLDKFKSEILYRLDFLADRAKDNNPNTLLEFIHETKTFVEKHQETAWIRVEDGLPSPEQEINYLDDSFEPKNFYLIQLKDGLIDTVYYATICDDCEYSDIFISCTVNVKENRYCVQERGFDDYRINEVKYWQPMPHPPKE